MDKKDFYNGFDEEKQKQYELQARQRWGDASVEESSKKWNAYTPTQKNAILAEGHEITMGIAANMNKGFYSSEVQDWVARWYKSINTHFYTCSLEIFEALGHGYTQDAQFSSFYENIQPGLAAFMEKAMTHFCRNSAPTQT